MGVYKHENSPYLQYDFQFKGRRFFGSTGLTSRPQAEAFERKQRVKAALGDDGTADLSFDDAAGRWWSEVGQHHRSARIIEHRLETAVRLIGPTAPLCEITTATVSQAVEKRRRETYTRGFDTAARDGKPERKAANYTLSNDAVNSDVVKRVRPILNRAVKVWGARGLPAIDWVSVTLPERVTEIRWFPIEYQQAWIDACGQTEAFALQLLFAYGLRFAEIFFTPAAYAPDMPGGPVLLIEKRKAGKPLLVPLRDVDAVHIAARVDVARAAGLATIWIEKDELGRLVEVKYAALQSRLRKAADRAGVDHARLIHSVRHHFGTDFLAATGDVAKVQAAMGHGDVKSTLRYAHVLNAGLRDALGSRNSPVIQPIDGFILSKQVVAKG